MGVGSIESGGSMGAVASVGPSLNTGPAFGGFKGGLGSLASLGPKLEVSSLSFVSESLVKGGVEKTMQTYTINNIDPNKGGNTIEPIYQVDQAADIGMLGPTDPLAEIAEAALQPSSLITVIESFLSEARLNNLGESKPALLKQDAVAEAEHILGLDQSKLSFEPAIFPAEPPRDPKVELQPALMVDPDLPKLEIVREEIAYFEKRTTNILAEPVVVPFPLVSIPDVEPESAIEQVLAPQTKVLVQTESKVSSPATRIVSTPVIQQQEVEQIEQDLEESEPIKIEEDHIHEEDKKVSKARILHVVDKDQITKRIIHGFEVLVRALQIKRLSQKEKVPVKITAAEVLSQFIPSNKREIRGGEINTVDPEERLSDETWDATVDQLKKREFASEEEIVRAVTEAVEENHPVKIASNGQLASDKNIAKSHERRHGNNLAVLRFEERKRLKKEQTVRVIKKGLQVIQTLVVREVNQQETKTEGTIHDHVPLAQALKAA